MLHTTYTLYHVHLTNNIEKRFKMMTDDDSMEESMIYPKRSCKPGEQQDDAIHYQSLTKT